jgi:hypothetical protein
MIPMTLFERRKGEANHEPGAVRRQDLTRVNAEDSPRTNRYGSLVVSGNIFEPQVHHMALDHQTFFLLHSHF